MYVHRFFASIDDHFEVICVCQNNYEKSPQLFFLSIKFNPHPA